MKFSEMFPSKFLKAADLNGNSVNAIIEQVEIQDVVGQGKKQDHKPVVFFQGKEKGLVCNKTNGQAIADAYGDDTEAWQGKELEVYPDRTSFQGKLVDCIRVRIPVPPEPGNDGANMKAGW